MFGFGCLVRDVYCAAIGSGFNNFGGMLCIVVWVCFAGVAGVYVWVVSCFARCLLFIAVLLRVAVTVCGLGFWAYGLVLIVCSAVWGLV